MRILKSNLKQCEKENCFKEKWQANDDFDGHCCIQMAAALKMCDIGIDYNKKIRMYDLSVPGRFLSDSTVCVGVQINVCPWCGTNLPKDLADEYEEILKKEYGITDTEDIKQEGLIPDEFKTDEWWKKRGL